MIALRRIAAGFARDGRAVAAVEFGLILPFMMLMYLGTVELTQAVSNSRKVTLLARTMADLAARGPISSTTEIFQAGAAVLAPFDASGATLVISAVGVYGADEAAQGRVCSSASNKSSGGVDTGKLATNAPVTVPAGFKVDKMRYLTATVSMDYTPMLGSNILQWVTGKPSLSFSESQPWPTRSGAQHKGNGPEVVMPGGQPCPEKLS